MKQYQRSYSYSASKFEHHEQISQSNYTKYQLDDKPNPSSYHSLAQDDFLDQSIGNFNANESSHIMGNKPTNYYAQAQCALPSPSIHVQEEKMRTLKRHESQVGQEWASNSPKSSSPLMADQSRLAMSHEKHKNGEMDHGWSNKPNPYSSPTQSYQYGQSMYKGDQMGYNNDDGGVVEGGYANKIATLVSPKHLNPIKTNKLGHMAHKREQMMGNIDHGFSSPTQARHSSYAMDDDDRMMGKGDNGWANSPTKFYSPTTQAQRSSFAMQNDDHFLGKTNGDWVGSTQSPKMGLPMHKHMMENNVYDWPRSPNKYSNSTRIHHTDKSIHNEKNGRGGMDHGRWANAPGKYSGLAQTYHDDTMHNEEHMTGKMDHGWSNSPSNKYSSPIQSHHSGLTMNNQEHMARNMNNGWNNSPNKYSSPTQTHYSSHTMHKEEQMMGGANCDWANSPAKYSGPNHISSSNNAMYGESEQHGWGGKSGNGYGPNQLNQSAHASYDDYDQHVDEGVHDIMDEILTKYPAHNVSGGHGSGWAENPNTFTTQNQSMGYAKKQQAFGASAHYGSSAQTMASACSKFAANKEVNAGLGISFNKEASSSNSSAKKFVAKIMIGRRG